MRLDGEGADEAQAALLVGEDAHHAGAAADLLVEALHASGWEENIAETLTFYRLPREHHKHLKKHQHARVARPLSRSAVRPSTPRHSRPTVAPMPGRATKGANTVSDP